MRVRRAVSEIAGLERICDDIDASIEQALRELRAIAYFLHPQELQAEGMKTTIEQYVNGFSARTSLKVSLEITQEAEGLPYEAKRSLLSVIQEALSNVFRHAKATQVKITMQAEAHFLLQISDNGRGITTGGERISSGVGIPGMRARLRQREEPSNFVVHRPRNAGGQRCAQRSRAPSATIRKISQASRS